MSAIVEHNKESARGSFLEAMSRVASTVGIVTTDGPAGRAGVTVSSLVSVSADGPLPTILVCIHESSAAGQVILSNGVFCVNVLRRDQEHIADTFAGRIRSAGEDKFSSAHWVEATSAAPRLVDPLAALDCHLSHSKLVGTHHVIFGEVQSLFIGDHNLPLVYANRAYATTMPLSQFPETSDAKVA